MATYLEQVLGAAAKAKQRTQRSQASVAGMAAMLQAKKVAQEMAARQAAPPVGVPGGMPRPSGGGGGGGNGPHHKHDGHNHGSGGAQSVGEANELWRRLQKMIAASPHKITPGPRSRDYATQVRLWNAYKAGKGAMAARPGTSKHGNGRANDLKYSNEAARQWALANAKNFGLAFPLYNPKLGRGRDESWHVELG